MRKYRTFSRNLPGLFYLALLLAAGPILTPAQNLLLNGGFEFGLAPNQTSTALGPWKSASESGGGAVTALGVNAEDAIEGTGVVILTGDASLTQIFPTTIGRQYQVKLFYAGLKGVARALAVRVHN